MKCLETIAVGIFLVGACAKGSDKMYRHVYFHCSDLAHEIHEMAAGYETRLTLSQTTALSEQQQRYADLKYRIVGGEARGERGLAMERDFFLCSAVRNADQHHIDALQEKFAVAEQTYREAADLATAAKGAADMGSCIDELDKLEIRP